MLDFSNDWTLKQKSRRKPLGENGHRARKLPSTPQPKVSTRAHGHRKATSQVKTCQCRTMPGDTRCAWLLVRDTGQIWQLTSESAASTLPNSILRMPLRGWAPQAPLCCRVFYDQH